jgi:hypothetical protein
MPEEPLETILLVVVGPRVREEAGPGVGVCLDAAGARRWEFTQKGMI